MKKIEKRSFGLYSVLILAGVGVFFILSAVGIIIKSRIKEKDLVARRALLESLALSSLAITSECNSARTPLEGICNSAGDIPGGYPYHSSCDVINPPKIFQQQLFNIKITK